MHKYTIILPKVGKVGIISGSNWKEKKNYRERVHENIENKSKKLKNIGSIRGFCKYVGNVGTL